MLLMFGVELQNAPIPSLHNADSSNSTSAPQCSKDADHKMGQLRILNCQKDALSVAAQNTYGRGQLANRTH